ncbi:MAG TPA: hypothetical protein VG034_20130 [Acidimicrobiia bacterium]|nr:hypothetical protein [Acidimicrobiia bacterium]
MRDGQIVTIGMQREGATAYDTGLFLCSPGIFAGVEASIRRLLGRLQPVGGAEKDVGTATHTTVDGAGDARLCHPDFPRDAGVAAEPGHHLGGG